LFARLRRPKILRIHGILRPVRSCSKLWVRNSGSSWRAGNCPAGDRHRWRGAAPLGTENPWIAGGRASPKLFATIARFEAALEHKPRFVRSPGPTRREVWLLRPSAYGPPLRRVHGRNSDTDILSHLEAVFLDPIRQRPSSASATNAVHDSRWAITRPLRT
jgi:hypothetical protein